jgi:outer membrane protein assembly factor BamB
MVSSERGLAASFVAGRAREGGGGIDMATTERVRWAFSVGSYAYGNPTVAGGRVIVGTDDSSLRGDGRLMKTGAGMVQCLEAETGKLLWRLVTPNRGDERLPEGAHFGQQRFGTCSSAAIVGDRAYVLTSADEVVCLDVDGLADGNDGPFKDEGQYMAGPGNAPVALEAGDADIIWIHDIVEEAGVCPHDAASCSPLVLGRFLYVGTSNGVDEPHEKCLRPMAPSLIVLHRETGRLVAADDEKIGTRMYHCVWSPPSMGRVGGRDLIFFGGGDGVCYAFEALTDVPAAPVHLKKVWWYDCNPDHYKHENGQPIPYYRGDKRKKYSTNTNDGTYVGPSQIIATPVFHEGRVYVPIGQDPAHGRGRGLLHCIDASGEGDITKGGAVWTYDAIERSLSSVAIADGLLYAPDLSGKLYCLEAATGRPVWVQDTGAETWGTPLVADGKVYLGTRKALFVFAAGREPKRLAQVPLGSSSYGTPVAANGVLYVASQRYLWAVK